jgi:Glycosyltransferase like family
VAVVWGCCVGASGKFETGLLPSLEAHGYGTAVLERRGQKSIFEAYNSLMAEAAALPDLEALVLVHDDVEVLDGSIVDTVRAVLADRTVGLIGVVGGAGVRDMAWWDTATRVGSVRHATHVDDFTRGVRDADTVDGLLMAVSPEVARTVRLRKGRYPGWHGYDAELCALVRATGLRVVVADLPVFHNCKPGPWGDPVYDQALHEWRARWWRRSTTSRLSSIAKREVMAAAARYPKLRALTARRRG